MVDDVASTGTLCGGLDCGQYLLGSTPGGMAAANGGPSGRGLHSFTFQLNLSRV